jgi:prepilin-type N-terminal cleavage/methylation domain-containing protein
MKTSSGYTLVEVTVAMLILAMVASGVFSVILTTRTTQVRSDRTELAILYQRTLDDALANYIGVDVDSTLACSRCGASCSNLGCPRFTGDSCGSNVFSTGCTHNADILLPAWFKAAPFSAKLCYMVTLYNAPGSGSAQQMKKVTSKLTWEEGTCTLP